MLVALLVLAGLVAAGVYTGVLGGGSDDVSVQQVPTCGPATKAALRPRDVRLNVYNGTSRAGLAGDTAETLRSRGFAVGTVANDPKDTHPKGTAVVRYGPKGVAAAKLVAKQLPSPKPQQDKRKGGSVDLVLGAKFDRLAAAPKPTASATPTPSCTTAPATTGSTKPTTKPTSRTPTSRATSKQG
ncbi:hypothetical protein GCM10025868_18830 [Angustibacter aerolatus]|uniref:LytR/CpsA/Psr regulator C-terminal domain-containing protein n=1 Tax=Angustibacter aerolatus TaxID=1162965 RepID=A0ABQ6JEL4_9ACTN|nr:hypothetical protein GCM10025868_18830 [Angustibacter aerolatus]